MRMRRAHHRRIGLTVEIKVIRKAALAGDEPLVFLARQRLADEAIGALRACGVVHNVYFNLFHATRRNSRWRSRFSSTSIPRPGRSGTSAWPASMRSGTGVTSSANPVLVTVRPHAICGATAAICTADAAQKGECTMDGKALIGVGRHQARLAALREALERPTEHHRAHGVGLGRAQTNLDLESAVACIPARLRLAQVGRRVFRSDDRQHRYAAALFAAEQSIDRPAAGAAD